MTALALTPDPDTGSVLLEVTGAPTPSATPYSQVAGLDSWATVSPGSIAGGTDGFILQRLNIKGGDAIASRAVAGLVVGTVYRLNGTAKTGVRSGRASLGVAGIGTASAVTPSFSSYTQLPEYVFTATATTHTLEAHLGYSSAFRLDADAEFAGITLEAVPSTYRQTTVMRTDANGSRAVRLMEGQEPIAGAMTVRDHEAALTGLIRYDLTDMSGALTSASTTLSGSVHTLLNRTNLATNPSGEVDANGWGPGFSGATVSRDTTLAHTGSASVKGAWATNVDGGTLYHAVDGLTAGEAYSAAMRVRVPAGSPDVRADVFFAASGDTTSVKDDWVTLGVTWTATGTGHQVGIATIGGTTAGQSTNVDAIIVVQGTVPPTDYFDGSTADTPAASYEWEGTAHASRSRELVAYPFGTKPQLHAVAVPQYRSAVELVTGYDATGDTTGTVHRVIGRRDPIVVSGPLTTREGTLTLWCADYTQARQLADVADAGELLMFRQVDYAGMDMYLAAQRATVRPLEQAADGWVWALELEYLEVDVPAGPLRGTAGWSWADVASSYATWDDVRLAFATWADLAVGP